MPATIIIGSQWGDEGKGKVVDYLASLLRANGNPHPLYSAVVRYQGGANAGHTIVTPEGEVHKFNLLPSSIIHPAVTSVLGNGVVIDLERLIEEMKAHSYTGSAADIVLNLKISDRAHVVLPSHKMREERSTVTSLVGTTKKGIGPCYLTKAERTGIRIRDLALPSAKFKELYQRAHNAALGKNLDGLEPMWSKDLKEQAEYLQDELYPLIAPFVSDTSEYLNDLLDRGENILLEGAQGSLLDLDHGDYPFVTSSNPTAGGACVGAGISPLKVKTIVGVVKAYCTRVGEGPFPSEYIGEKAALGEEIRTKGGEFGVVTGRPRRIGALDLDSLAYSCRINGFTTLALTKVDVLDGMVPNVRTQGHNLQPVIPWSKGNYSSSEISGSLAEYVDYIENAVNTPVGIVSFGQRRNHTYTDREKYK